MFGTSCLWLGFSCGISVPNPPPSFPAWICQNANHQSGSGSTAPLYLHQVGRSAHTLTHTLAAPLTAGQMQDGVCLLAQDWDLTSSEGALRPSRSYLLPAWAPSSWWHFLPSSPLPPPPGGPGEQFPLSRDPALGSLPSRVHGLSTPTPPHPTRLFSPLTIPPSPSVGGGSAQRRGDSGLFWAFPGRQTSFFSEALFCFHNPPTCRSVGTSEERRGRGSCPPHFLG